MNKAKQLFNNFWEKNTSLNELRMDLENQYMVNGFIRGLDDRKIFIRSKHSIVNALFQSAGSIVVKEAINILYDLLIPQYDIDARLILFQHDEIQSEVLEKDVETYCDLANESFKLAGEYFDLNVPIEGDSKVGKNWAETH